MSVRFSSLSLWPVAYFPQRLKPFNLNCNGRAKARPLQQHQDPHPADSELVLLQTISRKARRDLLRSNHAAFPKGRGFSPAVGTCPL